MYKGNFLFFLFSYHLKIVFLGFQKRFFICHPRGVRGVSTKKMLGFFQKAPLLQEQQKNTTQKLSYKSVCKPRSAPCYSLLYIETFKQVTFANPPSLCGPFSKQLTHLKLSNQLITYVVFWLTPLYYMYQDLGLLWNVYIFIKFIAIWIHLYIVYES